MLLKTQRSWSALIWIVVILSLILSLPINLMRSKKKNEKFVLCNECFDGATSYSLAVKNAIVEKSNCISVELTETFSNSSEYAMLLRERDLCYTGENVTHDQVDAFLAKVRKKCKDFYNAQTQEFLRTSGLDESLIIQFDYSHFIEIDRNVLNKMPSPQHVLKEIAKNNLVKSIYVEGKEDFKVEPYNWFGTWEKETLPTINGSYVGNASMLGDGVKVGIVENHVYDALSGAQGGIIVQSDLKKDFPNVKVHSRHIDKYDYTLRHPNDYKVPIGPHALKVSRILCNMTPNAEYYTSMVDNLIPSEYWVGNLIESINYMVENNVNVVNCSWGTSVNHYCWKENYFNQLSLDNLITFVFAAGNDKTKVSCPSSAANVICVGATDATGEKIADYSNFGSDIHSGCKPNIVANGAPHLPQDKDSFHTDKGTSLAAPMVTGAIAMQMSSEAKFKLYPEKLMPLLAASANDKKLEGYSKNQFGMDAKFGSGMLDVKKFLDEQNQCDAFWIDKTGNINISNHHFIPDSSDIGKHLKYVCIGCLPIHLRGGCIRTAKLQTVNPLVFYRFNCGRKLEIIMSGL